MADAATLVERGLELHQRGRLQEAAALYREALTRLPRHAEASHLLGLVEHQSGRRESAVRHLADAVEIEPDNAAYHSNLGVVLQAMGRLDEASGCYRRAIALDPEIAAVHNNLGVVLQGMGENEQAVTQCRLALALEPDYAEAHANLGLALRALGQFEQSAAAFRRAIELKPRYAKAHGGLGDALKGLGQTEAAIGSYRAAIALQPLDAGLHNNLGIALKDLDRHDEALESYRKAIASKPEYAEAHANLGNLLSEIGSFEEAVASYRRSLSIKPDNAPIHFALGAALMPLDRVDEAATALRAAYDIDPGHGTALSEYWRARGHGCDWRDIEALRREARLYVEKYGPAPGREPAAPFPLLAMFDDPALHLRAAGNLAARLVSRVTTGTLRTAPPGGKIRLAYVSSDFHDHATAYLIAELFEQHDRDRFEIHGISFGSPDDSPMRQRLERAFHAFHDLHRSSAGDIARAIADLGIDIVVDLKGYTQGAKTGIFAHRPAPIQVQYLGYPGTMGADFIDYVIADPVVIPEAEQVHYAERIAYLPHSYQVNDRQRPLPAEKPARRDCGLPESGFVFAAFNANYKITPEIFAVWMRLLRSIEGSVLWLLQTNAWAAQNLRREAAASGIDPERLVFAGRQPLNQHLARIANADLFLDTLPYNAHTTASDALWVGLPVVTMAGRSFAARVAASLLGAVGLPELVTTSLEAYEALALALATDPPRLAEMGQKLVRNRLAAPLFDTPAFTRHLEAAYVRMWQRHLEGKAPETFRIEAS
jgi:protein O-GlcNAc transferase